VGQLYKQEAVKKRRVEPKRVHTVQVPSRFNTVPALVQSLYGRCNGWQLECLIHLYKIYFSSNNDEGVGGDRDLGQVAMRCPRAWRAVIRVEGCFLFQRLTVNGRVERLGLNDFSWNDFKTPPRHRLHHAACVRSIVRDVKFTGGKRGKSLQYCTVHTVCAYCLGLSR
jgi:hypothetical protein